MRPPSTSLGAMQRRDPAVDAALTENRRDFLDSLIRRLGTAEAGEEVLQQFNLRALSNASQLRQRESVVD